VVSKVRLILLICFSAAIGAGGGDWDFVEKRPLRREHNIAFIRNALPILEQLDFVERCAWVATRCGGVYETAALFEGDPPIITDVGEAYRDF